MKDITIKSLLALVLCVILAGCAGLGLGLEPPKISIANLNVANATLFEQNYLIKLRIQNPNDADIPIKGMQYEITLNGQHFASGVSNQELVVPGLGSTTIDVEAVSTLLSVFKQLTAMQQGKLQSVAYSLNGKIFLSGPGNNIPFDYRGEIPIAGLGLTPQSEIKILP